MRPDEFEDLKTRAIPDLIADPLLEDHRWLLSELARTIGLAAQIEVSFPAHPSVPKGLRIHLEALRNCLAKHIEREERVVFPAVTSGRAQEMRGAIRALELEHVDMERDATRTRDLTDDLTPPEDADENWLDLYTSLQAIEERMRQHSLIEYRILFPRVFFEDAETGGHHGDDR